MKVIAILLIGKMNRHNTRRFRAAVVVWKFANNLICRSSAPKKLWLK